MITIQTVRTSKDLEQFIEFPYQHYRNAPLWVPPLKRMEYGNLEPGKNPAFEHSDVRLWLARKNGKLVGRIAGIINRLESAHRGKVEARFGWLNFIDDEEVSAALFQALEDWARDLGAVSMKGPMGFTNLDPGGMTVEGFEELGTLSGAYNYPYYPVHLEKQGFTKQMDWLEHLVEEVPQEVPDRVKRLKPIIEKKYGVRQHSFKTKEELLPRLREFFALVDRTYSQLPVYVPLSEKQVEKYIKQYINFLYLPYVSIITDTEDKMIGFGVCIPSFSEALQKARGSLFPFGFWHLYRARRNHQVIDLILIGVAEEWRGKGLNAIIFGEIIEAIKGKGINLVRINPILEQNAASLALFEEYNPRLFRRRRLYGRAISQ